MKRLVLLYGFLAVFASVYSQTAQDLETAFLKSYEAEADSNYLEATSELLQVYQGDSYHINARIGWLYYLHGSYDSSTYYYEKAISLMPYAIEAKIGYAYPLSMLGNWAQVIRLYEEILKIDPQHSLINYRLGLIYYNQGQFDKALPYVERVVNLYPFDYPSVILLGWIHKQMGHNREAQILFEKALLIRPGDESALEGLGRD